MTLRWRRHQARQVFYMVFESLSCQIVRGGAAAAQFPDRDPLLRTAKQKQHRRRGERRIVASGGSASAGKAGKTTEYRKARSAEVVKVVCIRGGCCCIRGNRIFSQRAGGR
jgi:hypothetical protein